MRRILVAIKRVVDYNVRVHVREDGSGVDTDGVKMSVNPFCEIALEQALRLREQGLADEVVAVSIGPDTVQQQLRTCLAMGADRAIQVHADPIPEPLSIAHLLHGIVQRESPILVLLGKQAIDSDNNQTGQMLAGIWDRPQATFASGIRLSQSSVTVDREIDEGMETLELQLPAVITSDLRLNEPRFVRLPQILQAKKLPIEALRPDDLGTRIGEPQFQTIATEPAAARSAGIEVSSAAELVAALTERKLI